MKKLFLSTLKALRTALAGAGAFLFINAFTPIFRAPDSMFDPTPEKVLFVIGGVVGLAFSFMFGSLLDRQSSTADRPVS